MHPQEPVLPLKAELESDFQSRLAEHSAAGVKLSDEQHQAAAGGQRREKSRIEFPIV